MGPHPQTSFPLLSHPLEEGATALGRMCEPASLRTFMTRNVIWAFGLGQLAVIGFDTLKTGYLIASSHE